MQKSRNNQFIATRAVIVGNNYVLDRFILNLTKACSSSTSQLKDIIEDAVAKAIMFKNHCFGSALNLFIREHNVKICRQRIFDYMYQLQNEACEVEEYRLHKPYGNRQISIRVPRLKKERFMQVHDNLLSV